MFRKWSAYEFNHLLRFGFDPFELAKEVDINVPVEYITGKCEFKGEIFNVNKNVLIPRVETEVMVELAIENLYTSNNALTKKGTHRLEASDSRLTFADVGTGSGCIGISLAKELLARKVVFTCFLSDVSEEALEVASNNAKNILEGKDIQIVDLSLIKLKSGIGAVNTQSQSLMYILESDLLKNYPVDIKLDLILGNLPYIAAPRIKTLQKSVKDFEPLSALEGGSDGLKFIKKLIEQARNYLGRDGVLILEIDDSHTKESLKIKGGHIKIQLDNQLRNRFAIVKYLKS